MALKMATVARVDTRMAAQTAARLRCRWLPGISAHDPHRRVAGQSSQAGGAEQTARRCRRQTSVTARQICAAAAMAREKGQRF